MNTSNAFIMKIKKAQLNRVNKLCMQKLEYDDPKPENVSGYVYSGKYYTIEEYNKIQMQEQKENLLLQA